MGVVAGEIVANMVWDSHGFEDLYGGHDRFVSGFITQPLILRVAQGDDGSGSGHGDELMMIVGQFVGVQALHAGHEPCEVGVVDLLDAGARAGCEVLRGSPGGNSASPRLLRNGQRHAFVERTPKQGHLSSVRTALHADLGRVDLELIFDLLDTVDQTADTPRPGAVVSDLAPQRWVHLVEGIRLGLRATAASVGNHVVVHERYLSTARDDAGGPVHADGDTTATAGYR